jgi:hypothetical protein
MPHTLALPELVEAPPESDPYCYGTRMARRRQADGSYQMLRLPLTVWDVLHPQEGDHVVQSIASGRPGAHRAGGAGGPGAPASRIAGAVAEPSRRRDASLMRSANLE